MARPPVEVRPAAVIPPAKVEVPVVSDSRVPVRVREVAARSVERILGMEEVPVVVTSRVSVTVRPAVLILVAERLPEKVEVPAPTVIFWSKRASLPVT